MAALSETGAFFASPGEDNTVEDNAEEEEDEGAENVDKKVKRSKHDAYNQTNELDSLEKETGEGDDAAKSNKHKSVLEETFQKVQQMEDMELMGKSQEMEGKVLRNKKRRIPETGLLCFTSHSNLGRT